MKKSTFLQAIISIVLIFGVIGSFNYYYKFSRDVQSHVATSHNSIMKVDEEQGMRTYLCVIDGQRYYITINDAANTQGIFKASKLYDPQN